MEKLSRIYFCIGFVNFSEQVARSSGIKNDVIQHLAAGIFCGSVAQLSSAWLRWQRSVTSSRRLFCWDFASSKLCQRWEEATVGLQSNHGRGAPGGIRSNLKSGRVGTRTGRDEKISAICKFSSQIGDSPTFSSKLWKIKIYLTFLKFKLKVWDSRDCPQLFQVL